MGSPRNGDNPLIKRLPIKENGRVIGHKEVVAYRGLLDLVHRDRVSRIITKLVQAPTEANGQTAIVHARVRTNRGVFTALVRLELDHGDPYVRTIAQAQHWTALSVAAPEEAARVVAEAFAPVPAADQVSWLRMASLLERLPPAAGATPANGALASLLELARGRAASSRTFGSWSSASLVPEAPSRAQRPWTFNGVMVCIAGSGLRRDTRPSELCLELGRALAEAGYGMVAGGTGDVDADVSDGYAFGRAQFHDGGINEVEQVVATGMALTVSVGTPHIVAESEYYSARVGRAHVAVLLGGSRGTNELAGVVR